MERATVGGGCFWCIEAPMQELRGVKSVVSGYAGGHVEDPTYEAVCNGTTGHAEVVEISYDPDEIAYRDLLEVFFALHDPTTKDRQGPDVGSQYRSAVFYHDGEQREVAEAVIADLEGSAYDGIVTEVEPLETFYKAEEYHQNYYEKVRAGDPNTNSGYCHLYIPPKLEKVREKFAEMVQ
jgi:peptide-methionine (S)-S-oxide reductase